MAIKQYDNLENISDEEYHKILLSLGLLTDDDDWNLFNQQEIKYDEIYDSIGLDNYLKIVNKNIRKNI